MTNKNDIDDFFQEFEKKSVKKIFKTSKNKDSKEIKDVHDLIESARYNKKGPGKKIIKRKIFKKRSTRIIVAILTGAVSIGVFLFFYIIFTSPIVEEHKIYSMLAESSQILDDSGKQIDTIYGSEGERNIKKFSDLPKNTINAFIAIEDKTFYEHHGFNFIRLIGAFINGIVGGGFSGTSTITQQLSRNIWLHESMSEKSVFRKLREAYITIQLERKLTKDQIVEAYLNTISLGNHSNGIGSAANNYFSKDVKDLTLVESSMLAALPQAPSSYSYINVYNSDTLVSDKNGIFVFSIPVENGFVNVKLSKSKLIKKSDSSYFFYNDTARKRQLLVLKLMLENGFINETEYKNAIKVDIKSLLKPRNELTNKESSYFVDYLKAEIINDLVEIKGLSEEDATKLLYNGGLTIESTLSSKFQNTVYKKIESEVPKVSISTGRKDNIGNILNPSDPGILLYNYSKFIMSDNSFVLSPKEFELRSDKTLILKRKKRLRFYNVKYNNIEDTNVEIPELYLNENGKFYIVNGGIVNIPSEYKKRLENGDVEINKSYFNSGKVFLKGKNLVFPKTAFTLREKTRQPQSAAVIIEGETGYIKAMQGGRGTEGEMLYNRATKPRQPGSSIKPLSVYSPAIEMGYNRELVSPKKDSYGRFWTAASYIEDKKLIYQGKVWPKNFYDGYRGYMSMRKAMEQSVNTIAVQIQLSIGNDRSVEMLEKAGITSIETKNKSYNDLNPASLALGGLTNGISPLELASAYTTFANRGIHVEPVSYVRVLKQNGDVLIESKRKSKRVMSEETAFIVNDMLRSTVEDGIAYAAKIKAQPIAGKTGTTSDTFDIWFACNTPRYGGAIWIGNDINLKINEQSVFTAGLMGSIFEECLKGTKRLSFPGQPSNVVRRTVSGRSEYFINWTIPDFIGSAQKVRTGSAVLEDDNLDDTVQ